MKNFTNYHIMENNGMEEVISMIFQNNKNSRRNNTICRFSFILFMDEQILQKRRAPISKQEGWRSRALFFQERFAGLASSCCKHEPAQLNIASPSQLTWKRDSPSLLP